MAGLIPIRNFCIKNPDALLVLQGAGDGTFTPVGGYPPAGFHPTRLGAGDVDGDGVLDLVTADVESRALPVFRGKGDGATEPAVQVPTPLGLITALVLSDLDGDGKVEVCYTVDFGTAKPGTMAVVRGALR